MSILPKIFPRDDNQRLATAERQLIRLESQSFGRKIFGPIPENHHRDFFCLGEHTWIWHEDWIDDQGNQNVISTRYVIRPDGAIKSQNGQAYQKVSKSETRNLHHAIKQYLDLADKHYAQLVAA